MKEEKEKRRRKNLRPSDRELTNVWENRESITSSSFSSSSFVGSLLLSLLLSQSAVLYFKLVFQFLPVSEASANRGEQSPICCRFPQTICSPWEEEGVDAAAEASLSSFGFGFTHSGVEKKERKGMETKRAAKGGCQKVTKDLNLVLREDFLSFNNPERSKIEFLKPNCASWN